MAYDDANIFARLLRGEIPARKIYEDDHVLAFHDAFPKAAVHALIIPKGRYTDAQDFGAHADDAEILALSRAVAKVADALGLTENGFRLIANTRAHGGQEVPHYHLHLVGGEQLGPMLAG